MSAPLKVGDRLYAIRGIDLSVDCAVVTQIGAVTVFLSGLDGGRTGLGFGGATRLDLIEMEGYARSEKEAWLMFAQTMRSRAEFYRNEALRVGAEAITAEDRARAL